MYNHPHLSFNSLEHLKSLAYSIITCIDTFQETLPDIRGGGFDSIGDVKCLKSHPLGVVYFGDNLPILRSMPSAGVDLIYIDPPFNTGKHQSAHAVQTLASEDKATAPVSAGGATRRLCWGARTRMCSTITWPSWRPGWKKPRLLAPHGSLYFHIDYREVHYCKVLLDQIFGREIS